MKGTKTLLSYILFIVGMQYKVICRLPPRICEKDHFTCDNKDCIPEFWKCDGADDCGDNSDESDCPVKSTVKECDADEMKCNNGRCVIIEYKCDGEDDCGDNTDETNCTISHQTRQCDETTNFRCANNKCIPRSWTCNNIDDCGDDSDESVDTAPYCVPFAGCKAGFFQCNTTGLCIHNVLVCDTNLNCGVDKAGVTDKSDEMFCSQRTCEIGEFKCDNGRCISNQWKCDKQNDCGDSSDERNCSVKTCASNEFKCVSSGHCIDGKYRCDDFHDCLDGSDEKGCNMTSTRTTTTAAITTQAPYTLVTTKSASTKAYIPVFSCKKDQYTCKGEKRCLLKSWVCDGEADCKNLDDESAEVCTKPKCEKNHFQCQNKKCVDEKNVCDGYDHCGDKSDEQNCSSTVHVRCSKDAYMCKGSHKCIAKSSVCDSKNDCPFADDEDAKCGVNECLKNNGNCSSICRDLPIGYKCECHTGYEMDAGSKKCVDVNECHVFGTCSQACVNYKGSFACQCNEGYSIDPLNNRTCRANGPTPYLYFTNRFDIRRLSSNGRDAKLVTRTRHVSALAVNYADKMLYWADQGLKSISRMMMNGSGQAEVIIKNVRKPEGLSIDWLSKKIYWTDLVSNHIGVSNLDGTHSKILYKGDDHEQIRAVEVYPEKGYLFWANWGGHSKIERANLDGTNKTTLIATDLIWPTSLVVDKIKDRLYWTEFNSICSIRIDGSGYKKIVHEGVSRPYGLAVFEDDIYWTDFIEKTIYKANKFNGGNMRKINGSYLEPLDIVMAHPLVQADVSHPCKGSNGGCSHLCFMSPAKKSFCACPDGMKLNIDQKTCTSLAKPSVPIVTIPVTKQQTTVVPTTVKDVVTTLKETTTVPTTVSQTTVAPTTEKQTTVVTVTEKQTTAVPVTVKQTTSAPVTVKPTTKEATTPKTEVTEPIKTAMETERATTVLPLITTPEPKVIIQDKFMYGVDAEEDDEPSSQQTVYIVIGVLCFVGATVFVVFGVMCVRKKRRQFDLSMVYETQRDEVYDKDEKDDVEKVKKNNKFIIGQPKKTKAFDNVNFKQTNNSVHIVNMMNDNMTTDDMTDDVMSDNSSICFDDRAPIMNNMA